MHMHSLISSIQQDPFTRILFEETRRCKAKREGGKREKGKENVDRGQREASPLEGERANAQS